MIRSIDSQVQHDANTAAGFDLFKGLEWEKGWPVLSDLAQAILEQILKGEGALAAAVAFPNPGLLAGASVPAIEGQSYRAYRGDSGILRGEIPEGWVLEKPGTVAGPGAGPWPADWIHSVETWPREQDLNWQHRTLMVQGNPCLAILALDADIQASGHGVAGLLEQIENQLQPVLGFWFQARQLQTQLQQARSENKTLRRLNSLQEKAVALASHEFKTPLTSITAYGDSLADQLNETDFPQARQFLEVIRSESGRLLRMVHRILDYSRVSAGQQLLEVGALAITPLVRESLEILQPAFGTRGQKVDSRLPVDLPLVQADADLVRQVLLNLIGNAVKYTPAGGRIDVEAWESEATVTVAISDTGPGISASEMQKIFREFYRSSDQTAEEGTGLGLYIVRNIINLHEGFLEVSRLAEGGTCFAFSLPKEIRQQSLLPEAFTAKVDRPQAWRLVSLLCYLAAELTGSRGTLLELTDDRDRYITVAAMGQFMDGNLGNECLTAEIGFGKKKLGRIQVGIPTDAKGYDPGTGRQLKIIAEVAGRALACLLPDTAADHSISASNLVAKVTEAVRAILQIRRSGIPTSSPAALDMAAWVGSEMGLGPEELDRLQYAAVLHDAGMARVEFEIVMGERELAWDQRDEVERHVEQGMDFMDSLLPDEATREIIYHHHERMDGSGYPRGLAGEQIPAGARVLAVIDAWFALTRDRTFRQGLSAEAALEEISHHAGTQFDPEAVAALNRVLKKEIAGEGIPSDTH